VHTKGDHDILAVVGESPKDVMSLCNAALSAMNITADEV